MNPKHRRQSPHNNSKPADFFSSLARLAFKILAALTLLYANVSSASNQASGTSQLQVFLANTLIEQFSATHTSNKQFKFPNGQPKLVECQTALEFKWRGTVKPGSNTLSIACKKPYWQSHASIYFEIIEHIVVSKSPLERGKPVDSASLSLKQADISQLKLGYFTSIEQVSGQLLQRTIKTGQVITPYIVKPAPSVRRGDWVTILTGKPGLTVTTKGEALKDGVIGEQIRVKNLATDSKIKAWVIKKGLVATKEDLI